MSRGVDLVIKVGGSLARDGRLAERLRPIQLLRKRQAVLVVPGGGAFADTVRAVSARHGLGGSTAHWMAILGMDQYAHVLGDLLVGGVVMRRPAGIAQALVEGALPVLAPFEWIHDVDPLPHSWSVTGDSIAAWVAGELAARKLILLKSRADRASVDAYFSKALPSGIECETLTPDSAEWHRIT